MGRLRNPGLYSHLVCVCTVVLSVQLSCLYSHLVSTVILSVQLSVCTASGCTVVCLYSHLSDQLAGFTGTVCRLLSQLRLRLKGDFTQLLNTVCTG